jgi:hypothetical protein
MNDTPISLTVVSHPRVVMLSISGVGQGGEQLLIGLASAAVVDDLIEHLLVARTITFGLNVRPALSQGFPLGGTRP